MVNTIWYKALLRNNIIKEIGWLCDIFCVDDFALNVSVRLSAVSVIIFRHKIYAMITNDYPLWSN